MCLMKTIRWGIIGLGWFGEVHAEVLSAMPGVELAAVCTRRPQRLAEVADRLGVPRRYADFRQLLADPDIDVVGITTHIQDHRDIAERAPGFFMVGHICRFDPRVVLAKQAIDAGEIGQIVSMHARRNLSVTIGRLVLDSISALMGDGIHDGDLMLWFSQARPLTVYAQEIHPGPHKYPDGGWAMARLDNGAIAVIESIWHLPESSPYQIDARMEIIGTHGAIYINCGEAGLEIHDGAGNRRPDTLYWPNLYGQRFGILRAELRYFADCVAAGRRPERITPRESRAAVELLAAAVESAQSGQIVYLPRKEPAHAV
jgi:predicted dehydrogenase